MDYIIAIMLAIILTSLARIVYIFSGSNFYVAYISGAFAWIVFNYIIDYKKRRKKI